MDISRIRQSFDIRFTPLVQTQSIILRKFNHIDWLGNFDECDLPLAYHMISRFIYISESSTDLMLGHAIRNLSSLMDDATSHSEWVRWIGDLYFAPVRESNVDFSNSGNLFIGKVKKILPIEESKIIGRYEDIYQRSRDGKTIVLIDDFVGTGDQFIAFMQNLNKFGDISSIIKNMIYCPIVCCKRGKDNIDSSFKDLRIVPLHVLSDRYDIQRKNSVFWPNKGEYWINEKKHRIVEISREVGIPDEMIFGYKELGLCLAFQQHIPDATLPIFTWNQNGWKPLLGAT